MKLMACLVAAAVVASLPTAIAAGKTIRLATMTESQWEAEVQELEHGSVTETDEDVKGFATEVAHLAREGYRLGLAHGLALGAAEYATKVKNAQAPGMKEKRNTK